MGTGWIPASGFLLKPTVLLALVAHLSGGGLRPSSSLVDPHGGPPTHLGPDRGEPVTSCMLKFRLMGFK
jgi:hypothetical protein